MRYLARSGRAEMLWFGAHRDRPGFPIRITDEKAAIALLQDLGRDAWGKAVLRKVLEDIKGRAASVTANDDAVQRALSRLLVMGDLMVFSAPFPNVHFPDNDGPEPIFLAKPPAQPTWVEVRFVYASTGQPVRSLEVSIEPPNEDAAKHTTNAKGTIRVSGIKCSGRCKVTSDIKGIKREAALVIVDKRPPEEATEGDESDPPPDNPKLTIVHKYKVKTGDTLDKLAKKVGLTETELANFMWGTDDKREVNRHMRWDVGCTTKQDGNFVFDDKDDPGFIFLPEPVELSVPTAKATVCAVERLDPARPWIFSL